MELKIQGNFRELSNGQEKDLSIKDFINKEDLKKVNNICKYLSQGVVIIAYAGICTDVINSENGMSGVPDLMTDGTWVWSGELEYSLK